MYNIKTINPESQTKFTLEDIQNRKVDGLIFENVISKEICKEIVSSIYKIKDLTFVQAGLSTFPMAFSQISQLDHCNKVLLNSYFDKNNNLEQILISKLKFNIIKEIKNKLELFTDKKIKPTIRIHSTGSLPLLTIRILKANQGSLKPHCENYFFNEFASLFKKLSIYPFLSNPISFFLLLQKPLKGGCLNLYPLEWSNTKKRVDDFIVQNIAGDLIDLNNICSQKIVPKVGDLVVFSGGQIWHQVEKPLGNLDRISIGGFLSFNEDKSEIYSWS